MMMGLGNSAMGLSHKSLGFGHLEFTSGLCLACDVRRLPKFTFICVFLAICKIAIRVSN